MLVVPWSDAVQAVQSFVRHRARGRAVVAMTGPVGAGKTTLARLVSDCVISTDHYLPDYERVAEHERDLPRHADFARLAQDLASLRSGLATRIPVWSFQTHRREGERIVSPGDLIVVEGIHALHEPANIGLSRLIDVRIFVEAPRDVRWKRWEVIESSGQRGWGVEKARIFFDQVAEPTFAKYEAAYRAKADIVVVNTQQESQGASPRPEGQ